mgnify:CR=1 FL=1
MDVLPSLSAEACYRAVTARDARFDGRFHTCVKTTGIYCRPVCPARTPLFANVEFVASAAEAEALGYRPCLRCRPETAPDYSAWRGEVSTGGAWRGTANTVSRALQMIDEGALDEDGLERLADRLGVGERHLRRLFRAHLGASPVAVAQTRRVRLAKANLLTPGLVVELAEVPDAPAAQIDRDADPYPVLPSVASDLPDLNATMEGMMKRINALQIEELIAQATRMMASIDALARDDQTRAAPEAFVGLVEDARGLVGSAVVQALPGELQSAVDEPRATVSG